MNEKWDRRFLEMAKMVAGWSKDPSSQVGAVITQDKYVVSLGYNGLSSYVPDNPEILNNRELKYKMIIHAEMNAILQADRDHLLGSTLYVYPFLPCSNCASAIIQSNIIRVVSYKNTVDRWQESIDLAKSLFKLAHVKVVEYLN